MIFRMERKIDLGMGSTDDHIKAEMELPTCHFAYVIDRDGDAYLVSICEIQAVGKLPISGTNEVLGFSSQLTKAA